jgi:LysM domain-containing protein
MRSLATLGGVIVLIVLAIAWKISNQVEAGQLPDPNSGVVMLGTVPNDSQTAANQDSSMAAAREAATNKPSSSADPQSLTESQPTGSSSAGADSGDLTPGSASNKESAKPDGPQGGSIGPPSASSDLVYTVLANETMYGILLRAYGKASPDLIEAVAAANDLDDPSALKVGQPLRLPLVEGFPAPKNP